MLTPSDLNQSRYLFDFFWNRNYPEPRLEGCFADSNCDLFVAIIPGLDGYEVFVCDELLGTATSVGEIVEFCQIFSEEKFDDDFEDDEY